MELRNRIEELLNKYPINKVMVKNIDLDIQINADHEENIELLNEKNILLSQIGLVDNMLSILNDTELTLIEMRYFKKMRVKDIAAELNYAENHVSMKKRLILDKISKTMVDNIT